MGATIFLNAEFMLYENENNYRKSFMLAAVLHIGLFIVLIMHFKFSPKASPVVQNSPNIIKAVTVSQSQLQNQLASLQAAQQQVVHEQQVQQQAAQQQTQQAQLAVEKAQEEKTKVEQAKRIAALKVQQEKAKEEQKRLAQQAIQQALQQQDQQAEQVEQAKQAQQKQKQLQAAKLAAQQLLQQQLADSGSTANNTHQPPTLSAAAQGQVDKFSALIIQAIGQQWIIPDAAKKDLAGKMQVKLAPGGMVVIVTITQSSSDSAFDRSARAAVFKASPLPVPKDSTVFNQFRTLNLTFQPQGITSN